MSAPSLSAATAAVDASPIPDPEGASHSHSQVPVPVSRSGPSAVLRPGASGPSPSPSSSLLSPIAAHPSSTAAPPPDAFSPSKPSSPLSPRAFGWSSFVDTMGPGTKGFLVWLCALAAGSALNRACQYVDVSKLARSFRLDPLSAAAEHEWGASFCPQVPLVAAISPHSVSDFLASWGPLPTWGILAFFLWRERRSRHIPLLLSTILAFVTLAMPVRYMYKFLSFDPSGHTLVFGAQMLPTALILDEEVRLSTRRRDSLQSSWPFLVLGVIAAVNFWFSVASVVFFHTPTEVWLVLSAYLTVFAACKFGPLSSKWSAQHQRVVLQQAATATIVMWGICTAAVFIALGQGYRIRVFMLLASVAFDIASLLLYRFMFDKFSSDLTVSA